MGDAIHHRFFIPLQHVQVRAQEAVHAGREFLSTIGKSQTKALQTLGFKEVAHGKVKRVIHIEWTMANPIYEGKTSKETVFYVAVRNRFGVSREKALRQEKAKMDDIKEKTNNKSGQKYLAVEAKETTKVEGHYALEVEKASGDWESVMTDANTRIQTRVSLAQNYLDGLSALNEAGYAYGDVKPENCLVYTDKEGNKILKLADFGKAKEVPKGESRKYTGNPRFAPPEGTLSQKGDTWGAALCLIRQFEEAVSQFGEPLIEISQDQLDPKADKTKESRRGIEQYVCNHEAFAGCDGNLLDVTPRRLELRSLSAERKEEQQELVHAYINALTMRLSDQGKLTREQAADLNTLLKAMTQADPDKRLSSADAAARFKEISPPQTPVASAA